jgi:hypothetical protein
LGRRGVVRAPCVLLMLSNSLRWPADVAVAVAVAVFVAVVAVVDRDDSGA